MRRTIVALDPHRHQRSLLIEVHGAPNEAITQEARRAFYDRLFRLNIRVGLLMSPDETRVIVDLLTSMEPSDNRYSDHAVQTALLFSQAGLGAAQSGSAFYSQVKQWLEAVATSWFSYLHPDAVQIMVPDVIGNLAEAELEEWDDTNERSNAA